MNQQLFHHHNYESNNEYDPVDRNITINKAIENLKFSRYDSKKFLCIIPMIQLFMATLT